MRIHDLRFLSPKKRKNSQESLYIQPWPDFALQVIDNCWLFSKSIEQIAHISLLTGNLAGHENRVKFQRIEPFGQQIDVNGRTAYIQSGDETEQLYPSVRG